MKIQTKITLLISAVAIIFIIGIILFKTSEDEKISNLYKERKKEIVASFNRTIESAGKSLAIYAYDYTIWDEMIDFVNKPDSTWAYLNIFTTIPSFDVQFAWVYNENLTLIYSANTLEQSAKQYFILTKEMSREIFKNGYFCQFYLMTEKGLLEIRGAPVQPSNDLKRETKPQGYLFVGRLLTEKYLKDISVQTSAKVIFKETDREALLKNAEYDKNFNVNITIPLKGWDGKPVVWLSLSRYIITAKNLDNFLKNQVLYSLGFAVLVLVIVSISLFTVVGKPLKTISKSLEEKNTALLNGLLKDKAEFGKLSSLIVQFFKLSESSIQKLSSAIEQSPVSVIITNTTGEIEYVNPKFTLVSGYTLDEVKGSNIRNLKSALNSEENNKVLWEAIGSGKELKCELLNKNKDDELYWESVLITPIKDSNSEIINYLIIKEDITEKKNYESELRIAKENAEESNRLKSNFLANMSHELRTPMVGILGFANILSSELKDPEYVEMAQTILKSGSRLTDTLNSILDLSRIESNKLDLNFSLVNLTKILSESVNLYKPMAHNKGLYLNYIFPPEPVLIESDKEILLRAFNNLINNAVKFTIKGSVTIKVYLPENHSDKNIAVDIIDTGIGIPKEYNEIIFKPFRQVSDGFSRKFEGSGLGLSITKKIVELLNGSISFESTPGEGTTFTVLFPLTKLKDVNPVSEDKVSYVTETRLDKLLKKPSILLVENNQVNASVICTYLKDYALVDHFFDGSEAVAKCKIKLYDAVLMDINLKGIDGVEALNLIRRINGHYSNIPVIALTAYAMTGDKEKFLSLGFTHYLSKPFQPDQLLNLLSEIFERSLIVS
jgi:PAS domain S-box-containing protein